MKVNGPWVACWVTAYVCGVMARSTKECGKTVLKKDKESWSMLIIHV